MKFSHTLMLFVVSFAIGSNSQTEFASVSREESDHEVNDSGEVVKFVTPELNNRIYHATIGAIIGDSGSVAYQGTYDMQLISEHLAKSENAYATFHKKPILDTYKHPAELNGEPSHYGREFIYLLKSVAKHGVNGTANQADLVRDLIHDREDGYYLDDVNTEFLANVEGKRKAFPSAGSMMRAGNAFAKVPVCVAAYAGSGHLESMCEALMTINQAGHMPHVHGIAAAQVLEGIVLGRSIKDAAERALNHPKADANVRAAYQTVVGRLQGRPRNDFQTFNESTRVYGVSANFPKLFLWALHSVLGYDNLEHALQDNILIGGESPVRALWIGACFAAANPSQIKTYMWERPLYRDEVANATLALMNGPRLQIMDKYMRERAAKETDEL